MQSGYKVVLAFAAISTLGVIALPQFAKTQEPTQRDNFASRDGRLDRIVKVHFDHATVDEVLAWLTSQGVNYVVRDPEAKDIRVSINIENRPLHEVVQALADALGGSWRREGEVHVLRRGPFAEFQGIPLQAFAGPDGKNWEEFGRKMGEWGQRFGEDFARKMPPMPAIPPMPPMPDMPQMNEDHNSRQWKDYEKQWKDWGKRFHDEMKQRGGERGWNIPAPPNGPNPPDVDFDFDMDTPPPPPAFDRQRPRNRPPRTDIRVRREGSTSTLQPFNTPLPPDGHSLKALIHSLTGEQRAKQDRQGYLTPMDLTEEQIHLLGVIPNGDHWTMSFQIDGEKLEIRNR